MGVFGKESEFTDQINFYIFQNKNNAKTDDNYCTNKRISKKAFS
jgi:hypothetical protein